MERLFKVHKPRIQDLCFMNQSKLTRLVKSSIRTLDKISNSPTKWLKYLTRFIKRFPYILTYILVLAGLSTIRHILVSDVTDSIYLHSLLHPNKFIGLAHQLIKTENEYSPKVIGIIPDGNRRWGKYMGMDSSYGHFFGAYKISNLIRWSIIDSRVSHLVIYLLSYDNYKKRSKEEQDAIKSILKNWVGEFTMLQRSNQVDIAVLGEPDTEFKRVLGDLPVNPKSRDLDKTRVSLLLCYEGRREIQKANGNPKKMWLQEDIDVVIRTGYTQRSSGFCTFQTAYSEWVYPGMYWPEFTVNTFHHILEETQKIQRNFGK